MKVLNALHKIIDTVVSILFAVLVVLVLVQVITRAIHMSQTWIDEASKFVFVWTVYLGGAITVRKGSNICFDLILEGTTGKSYKVLFTCVNIVSLVFLVLLTIFGTQAAWLNRAQVSTMLRVNMGLMNAAIPIGCVFMIISQLEYYFANLHKKDHEEVDA